MALPAAESTQPAVLAAATAVAPANTETPPTAAALSVTLACAQSLTGEDGGRGRWGSGLSCLLPANQPNCRRLIEMILTHLGL